MSGGAASPVTRIAVHGASGSGKTTLATALAARLGVARTELDALFHQPGWTARPVDEFRAEVAARAAGPGWVIDGNYRTVRDLVWARAQLIVILDLPRWRVMAQLLRRTVTRSARRAIPAACQKARGWRTRLGSASATMTGRTRRAWRHGPSRWCPRPTTSSGWWWTASPRP